MAAHEAVTATIRLRLSQADAHYGGGLVAAGTILELIGDVATELMIRHDGDEGLLRAYDSIELLAPVHAGDFIEVHGRVVGTGRTSRTCEFEAMKVIAPRPDLSDSAADVLAEPIVVARARATVVVLADRQRPPRGAGEAR